MNLRDAEHLRVGCSAPAGAQLVVGSVRFRVARRFLLRS